MEQKRLFATEKGTPQGGTISLMIMNMVQDGLETQIQIIRPSKESVQLFKVKIRTAINQKRGIPVHALIRILNPVIRDWSNYHKGICSKRIFNRLAIFIWWQLRRWAKYQHRSKNRWWIYHRYYPDNHFPDQRTTKIKTMRYTLKTNLQFFQHP